MKYGKSRLTALILALAMCLSLVSFQVQAEEGGSAPAAPEPQSNESEVDLYSIDPAYEEYLTIPSSCPQSYQIEVADNSGAKFSVYSGNSVTVSSSGLIQPAKVTWYLLEGDGSYSFWTTTYIEGAPTKVEVEFGTSVVLVQEGESSRYITVTVYDYAQKYAEQVMDDYIADNITADMSDLDKLEVITAFPAQYDYSPKHSGYVGLIVAEGGDCWASCDAILYLCEKVGLPAHIRYGVNDGGAGSGHRNVAVLIDPYVYIAEAGYSGTAPRLYSVDKENTGFMYTRLGDSDTVSIVQYDGFDSDVVVPAEIDGYTVTSIGKLAFYYGERYSGVPVESLTLPDTLTTIEDQAIESCDSLTSITIPASVTSIGSFVFTDCESLEAIYVAEGNSCFSSDNGVLYDASGKTLLYYPTNGADSYMVREGTEEIEEYAFYYTNAPATLLLWPSIQSIGEGAFGDSSVKSIYFTGNRPDFGQYAFQYTTLTAYYPQGDATWDEIDSNQANEDADITWKSWDAEGIDLAHLKDQKIQVADSITKTYGDDPFNLEASVLGNVPLSYLSSDTDVVEVSEDGTVTIIGTGTAEVYIQAAPSKEYMAASVSVTITVEAKPIENCRLIFTKIGELPYDKSEFSAYLAVMDGTKMLTEGKDYRSIGSSWFGKNGLLYHLEETIWGLRNYTGSTTYDIKPISEEPTLTSAVASSSGVTLSWEEESGAMGYLIYRMVDGGEYAEVKTFSTSSVTTWTDTNFTGKESNVSYYIKAYTFDGSQIIYTSPSNVKTCPSPATAAQFTDVKSTDWFYPYVTEAAERGLMSGTGNGQFSPYGTTTRAMFVQVLYAMAGKPDATGSNPFTDVPVTMWYANAVQWAYENGVTGGTSDTTFSPNANVTREQIAVFLYAYAGKPEVSGNLSSFADAAKVSGWAKDAVTWATQNKIISGSSEGGKLYLNPQKNATRAETATMMVGFVKMMEE